MTRKPRLQFSQVDYHVIVRCNNQAFRFETNEDFSLYLHILRKIKKKHDLKIYNYELMNSHVHLFLRPGPVFPLAKSMQQINWNFAYLYNRNKSRRGHLWLERYRNIPVQSGLHAMVLMRYINKNPVRAGMVERVGDWKWSAYPVLVGRIEDPLITLHPEYTALGNSPEIRQIEYAKWVQAPDIHEEQRKFKLSEVRFIGSEEFGKRLGLCG